MSARSVTEFAQKPKRGVWHWSLAYFRVGEKTPHGKITKVYRNKYGRVSYRAGDRLLMLEDLVPKGTTVIA